MPRPTAAQFAYGSATVVCSTLAMLLLSGATAGLGVAVIGTAGLGLGLLAALTVPAPRRTKPVVRAAGTPRTATAPATGMSAGRAHTGAEARIGEHSLRR